MASRVRDDGRRQFLLYMDPEVIKELKRAALDENEPAYVLAEVAVREWLKRRKRGNAGRR
jgi:predicted 2-oxoglutarate/Fe(II)-dependent dioxygenase YbiX